MSKKVLTFIVAFLMLNGLLGQGTIVLPDKPFNYPHSKDTAVWNTLTGSAGFQQLTLAEQEFFYWVNILRKNPPAFEQEIIQNFLRQFPQVNAADARSLSKDLKAIKTSLSFLPPDQGLGAMASAHATDLKNRNGIISHTSSTGKSFVQRIKEAGSYKCGAENVFAGTNSALEALILLLIDQGVPDKGHRKNLIDPNFNIMGVSFVEINAKKLIIVQDFGCK
ncbi:MAG: CAP domain-containing protein [Chitinophagaceae bacterium]|nr:CAP domain-containing protein [Chitinophagaceae bacterium]